MTKMTDFDATMIAEGNWEITDHEPNGETQIAAWQHLVDTGLAWKLQGAFGRKAAEMIEDGILEQPTIRVRLGAWGHGGQTV